LPAVGIAVLKVVLNDRRLRQVGGNIEDEHQAKARGHSGTSAQIDEPEVMMRQLGMLE
jgi:hypothetical protein